MSRLLLPVAALLLPVFLHAVEPPDLRAKVAPGVAEVSLTKEPIHPGGPYFGLAFGTTEQDLVAKLGQPNGYVRADEHRTALLYGTDQLVLCYDGKFDGFIINATGMPPELSRWMGAPPSAATMYGRAWALTSGPKHGMSLAELKKLIPEASTDGPYPVVMPGTRVHIEFGMRMTRGQRDNDANVQLARLFVASKQEDGSNRWSQKLPPNISELRKGRPGTRGFGIIMSADSENGIGVSGVLKGSPAHEAGLAGGDVITALNGSKLAGKTPREFSELVRGKEQVKLEVLGPDNILKQMEITAADSGSFGAVLYDRPAATAP